MKTFHLLFMLSLLVANALAQNPNRPPGAVVACNYTYIPNVPAGTRFQAVSAGALHNLVLNSDGTVFGWGWNSDGQCVAPANLTGVVAVAAGDDHSLALKNDGTVVAWGYNYAGQINVPMNVSNVIAIAAGVSDSFALKSDSTLVGWGYDYFGEVSGCVGLTNITRISAGAQHCLAIKANKTVVAWGLNNSGQCTVPATLSNVIMIAAGGSHSLALVAGGTVVAWGDNTYGQAMVPANLTGVIGIAAGNNHSLALKSDGTVVAWGAGLTNNPWSSAECGQSIVPANLSGVIAISAGQNHSLALKADGTIVAWGNNNYGQSLKLSDLANVTDISLGSYNCLALKSDGTLVSWGSWDPNHYATSPTPIDLSGVIGIAAGEQQSMALKADGTVVTWGSFFDWQSPIPKPQDLTGVTAVAAGGVHSLALKSDGTVVAWGVNSAGQCTVPASLSGVTAIAAGSSHSLALKTDGTVIAWGANNTGQCNIPPNLTGVTAIAASHNYNLALKSNHTILAWGYSDYGLTNVPTNLTNVMAVAPGLIHCVALRDNGAMLVWGSDNIGTSNTASTLTGVMAIAAGEIGILGITRPANQKPAILLQATNQFAMAGATVTFTTAAVSATPMTCQWWFANGPIAGPITGATNTTLVLTNVQWANAGNYWVTFSNRNGPTNSATAKLGLIASLDSYLPTDITTYALPARQLGKNNLVLVTHGWVPSVSFVPPPPAWVFEMCSNLQAKVPSDWQVVPYIWPVDARTFPYDVFDLDGLPRFLGTVGSHALDHGNYLGQQIALQGWQNVHLIAHSIGSALIQQATDVIRSKAPGTFIHTTFLDPFQGLWSRPGLTWFGTNADWSDNYFSIDKLTSLYTQGALSNSFNVDVTWLDAGKKTTSYIHSQPVRFNSDGTIDLNRVEEFTAFSSHDWPHDFYNQSITNSDQNWSGKSYGFALSRENGAMPNWSSYPKANIPPVPGGQSSIVTPVPPPPLHYQVPTFDQLQKALSPAGVSVDIISFRMAKSSPAAPSPPVQFKGLQSMSAGQDTTTNGPIWLALGLSVTNPVNFVQFDAVFTDTNSAAGLLSVFWDTNLIGSLSERYVSSGWQTYQFFLPQAATNSIYTLGFQLDAFTSTASSITVTNLLLGFVDQATLPALNISLAKTTPILQLTGSTNYNYLLESSTNLANWDTSALIVNTNGTVLFLAPDTTNSATRFYRARPQ